MNVTGDGVSTVCIFNLKIGLLFRAVIWECPGDKVLLVQEGQAEGLLDAVATSLPTKRRET